VTPEQRSPSVHLGEEALARAESVVAEWPELSAAQLAELRLLLRPDPTPQSDAAA
jgi:hypothetical protein